MPIVATERRARFDEGEAHDGHDVVIACNAAVPFEAAAKAAMDDRLFAVPPGEDTDWSHARTAVACAVARHAPVDVQ
jgi:hypothetical protein